MHDFYDNHYKINYPSVIRASLYIVVLSILYYIIESRSILTSHGIVTYDHHTITQHQILTSCIVFFITIQVTHLIRLLFFNYYLPHKRKVHVSSILINVVSFCIYLICVFIISWYILKIEIQAAIATTGAIGVVLGFGLQRMISDLFLGIAVDMDKSIQIGDWISLKYNQSDIVGCVKQMTWRIVTVYATDGKIYQIPNSVLDNTIIINLSHPTADAEFSFLLTIPFEYHEKKVTNTLILSLKAAEATGTISRTRCRIDSTTLNGICYKIKYWINPSVFGPGKARHFVYSYVLRFLRSEKIPFSINNDYRQILPFLSSFPQTDQTIPHTSLDQEKSDKTHHLLNIDIFHVLSYDQLHELSSHLKECLFSKGDVICQQGDEGQSLFILKNGYVKVYVNMPEGEEKMVAVLVPEDYFGEMSMLTGERRSATIIAESAVHCYEVPIHALRPLLEANDRLYRLFARTIADREAANNDLLTPTQISEQRNTKISDLEQKIRLFAKKILKI